MGSLIYQDSAHPRGPVGLALASNGDAVNSDPTQPSELIEFTPKGRFVGQLSLDPAQGAAFGVAFDFNSKALIVASVNVDTNTLDERFAPPP